MMIHRRSLLTSFEKEKGVFVKSVFVSHAVVDAKIAEAIVDLLENGIGVPGDQIFCSSLEGYGIPTGENFVSFIKGQMERPDIVILLLTPNYFASKFCLCEMGAAWVKSHKIFPVLVPPLTYDAVQGVIASTQVAKIDNDIKYNEIREYLAEKLELQIKNGAKWDTERKKFINALPKLLGEMELPEVVNSEEHQTLKEQMQSAQLALSEYSEEVAALKEENKKLRKAKDSAEVAEIVRSTRKISGIEERFEALLEGISDFKGTVKSRPVMKFMLCDFYGQPFTPDLYHDSEDYEQAARRKLISLEDSPSVDWRNSKMKEFHGKLKDLENLLEEPDARELFKYHEKKYDFPLETDNEEFWNFHYFN